MNLVWQWRFWPFTGCTLDDRCVTFRLYCVAELYHLPTFGELLTGHIERSGIGDSDLARRIGVSRLTLIRWKEGVTSRPRYREDVLRCAELLRLTPEERDDLLVSAEFEPEGFPPAPVSPVPVSPAPGPAESQAVAVAPAGPQPSTVSIVNVTQAPTVAGNGRRRRGFRVAGGAAVVAAAVAVAVFIVISRLPASGPDFPVASANESLIVIAPFANYTAGQQGFNIRGRLRTSIDREIVTAGLTDVRTVQWPEALTGEGEASSAGERSGAAIVIWGEYDSGRVLANLTSTRTESESFGPQVVDIASSPSELPTSINIDLTAEVRSVALLTLSQLYLEQEEFDLAKTVLIRALEQPPSDPAALANLRYRLGHAYLGGKYADLDEAIWRFTQVLTVQPRSADTYSSRGLAYLERGRPGDEDLAIRDLTRASELDPRMPGPYFNRAVAYMERGQPGDLDRALRDLERAIDAGSEGSGVYVNRAAAYLARGNDDDLDLAFDDLEEAIDIDPELATAWVNRGSAYLQRGEDGDTERAIADFTKAIELSPEAAAGYYNRGLVYSDLEDWERSNADLRAAQEREPRNPAFSNTLCWQLEVQQRPEEALPYCNLALEDDPDGPSRDSRGLVYGVMGRSDESTDDFRAFVAWVDASVKESCRPHFRPSRESWIGTLQSGGNPFDRETLRGLRVRPGAPGAAPC